MSGWQRIGVVLSALPVIGVTTYVFVDSLTKTASSVAEQQLKIAADLAWNIRWRIAWDMNADGVVTISDVGLWLIGTSKNCSHWRSLTAPE